MRSFALLASCLLLSACFAAAPPAKVPPEWLTLIDQLGEDDTRPAAEKKLDALGEDAVAPLRAAARTHADVDVRLRAAVLADAIERKTYGVVRKLTGHKSPVINFALSPDGRRLVSGSHGEKDKGAWIRVWDVGTGKQLSTIKSDWGVYGIAWSKNGKYVATVGSKTLHLYEVGTGKEMKSVPLPHPFVYQVLLTPKGDRAITSGTDKAVRVWDLATGKEVASNQDSGAQVRGLALTPDGKHVVAACGDGFVRVIEVETGRLVQRLSGTHAGGARFVAVSPDGKRIASVGADDVVKLHDAQTGEELKALKGHGKGGCHGVAFSPDGKRVLSAGYDHTARLWDVASGKELQVLDGHEGPVSQVAFLPDGGYAVTSSFDRTLRTWKLRR